MPLLSMTPEIAMVLGILSVTVLVLVTDALRADVVAVLIMVSLPWLGLVEPDQAFRGLSSGAVVSIIAVVVMGHGLDRSGVTQRMTGPILRLGGDSPRRLLGSLMLTIGGLSAVMQNVGAAALFLPVARRVGRDRGLAISRLLMPMGFAAILGGTLSMVGSSPLILLNDLLAAEGLPAFGLFAVTPIGLALLTVGLLFFLLFGRFVLPQREDKAGSRSHQKDLVNSWKLTDNVEEVMVPPDSPLIGKSRRDARLIARYGVHILAVRELGRTIYTPSTAFRFGYGQRLAVHGDPADIERFVQDHGLRRSAREVRFPELRSVDRVGYAEILISPRGSLPGKTLREVHCRSHWGVEPLALLSGGVADTREFADTALKPGDTIIVHGHWQRIRAMAATVEFALLTHLDEVDIDTSKGVRAAVCFVLAIGLALAGFSLPLSLFSGAVAMILSGVMNIDAAYRAVSWRTVFLLAGLIPLGVATERSGTARYVAGLMLTVLDGAPDLVILFAVAALTTAFTLFMSNVAATVVLVPLAMDLGRMTGMDPTAMALLVAVCAQNSFVLPTHQVNALLMGPGGYRGRDYLKAGGAMTLLFLPVAVFGIYLLYV